MKTILITASILVFLLGISCSKEPNTDCCLEPKNDIVKFKDGKEYLIDHLYVLMNKEKNEVIGYPDKAVGDNSPFDYYKGYYVNLPNFGVNTAYLSMTIEDFSLYCDTLSTSAMAKMVIEKDPYAEYYFDDKDYLHATWSAIDTAKFHRLVDTGELEKYLKRVK